MKKFFNINRFEDRLLLVISVIFIILFFLIFNGNLRIYTGLDIVSLKDFTFERSNDLYLLSSLIQSLAAIFAIVFTISLVAIQLSVRNLSQRVIDIYVENIHFRFLILIYLVSIVYNILVLSNIKIASEKMIDIGVLFSILAIFAIVPYMVSTINLLKPKRVVEVLISDIPEENVWEMQLEGDFYERYFQPIEDTISKSIKNMDYEVARYGIYVLTIWFIDIVKLSKDNGEKKKNIIKNVSNLLSRFFTNIGSVSYKNDAMEILYFSFISILAIHRDWMDNTYGEIFRSLIHVAENLNEHLKYRFKEEEYEKEMVEIELRLSKVLVKISEVS
ncbi:MAG: DUF2254 family protein, partial [Candidatus Methanofastidiosia archaeon]